jgi:hypothetical protein
MLTYTWGKTVVDSQKRSSTVSYMQSKLLKLRSNIIEVSHEGINSSRILGIKLSEGELKIVNGTYCSNNELYYNYILYNISADSKLVDSVDSWIIIDPIETNNSCYASLNNNSAGILLGRAFPVSNKYENSYIVWFRNLTDELGRGYIISIKQGDVSRISGGTYTIIARNDGVQNLTNTIYSNVVIDIY